jgi:hypothetical protein
VPTIGRPKQKATIEPELGARPVRSALTDTGDAARDAARDADGGIHL